LPRKNSIVFHKAMPIKNGVALLFVLPFMRNNMRFDEKPFPWGGFLSYLQFAIYCACGAVMIGFAEYGCPPAREFVSSAT